MAKGVREAALLDRTTSTLGSLVRAFSLRLKPHPQQSLPLTMKMFIVAKLAVSLDRLPTGRPRHADQSHPSLAHAIR